MKALIFCAIIYCIVKIIGKLNEREKQNRIVREQEAIKAEQTRQREQIRAEMERARLETKERIEAEKRRIEWQKRQAAINARLEKEQERQAKELERHEEMLRKHEFQIRQARRDIDFLNERLAQQYAMKDTLLAQQSALIPGSDSHTALQKKIITLDNQIHTTESRYNKAVFAMKEAKAKLA